MVVSLATAWRDALGLKPPQKGLKSCNAAFVESPLVY